MLFVCLWLCDSYRCSKLILIPKQAVIGSRAQVFQYFTMSYVMRSFPSTSVMQPTKM